MKNKWSDNKMIFLCIIGVVLISFYAIVFSYPSRWFKWKEWNEHINSEHFNKKY